MTILRIEEMIYGVNDLNTCVEFMENWGLEKVEYSVNGAVFKTSENQFIKLLKRDDASLPPTHEQGSTVREVIWGVENKVDIGKIAAELNLDRDVSVDHNGGLHSQDDSGNFIGFRPAEVIKANTQRAEFNFHENIERLNARAWPDERAHPLRIGHIVYSIEREGNWDAAKFYMDRLNFRLSDRSKDGGTFLRCDGSQFHHTLFLFHRQGTSRYFNHVAFEVNSFDEIMTGGRHMLESGAQSISGPGRHSLGSNLFWYFKNPCGGDIEYFADMDRMTDDWEPRFWDESPPYARWMIGDDVLTG